MKGRKPKRKALKLERWGKCGQCFLVYGSHNDLPTIIKNGVHPPVIHQPLTGR